MNQHWQLDGIINSLDQCIESTRYLEWTKDQAEEILDRLKTIQEQVSSNTELYPEFSGF